VSRIAKLLFCVVLLCSFATAQSLNGAGATFPYPIYSKWFSEYSAAHPGVEINYQSIGSGGGIRQMVGGLVDFGATDAPATDEQLAPSKTKLIHIPTVMGAVVPIFNVPGVSNIRFSADVLADIYLNKITNWSDPRIVKDNPGVTLPNLKIIVVHRADGSGTTYIFTDYLCKVSSEWASGPGRGASPSSGPSWACARGNFRMSIPPRRCSTSSRRGEISPTTRRCSLQRRRGTSRPGGIQISLIPILATTETSKNCATDCYLFDIHRRLLVSYWSQSSPKGPALISWQF